MYSKNQFIRGLKSPNLFLREINRLYFSRLNTRKYNKKGIKILDEDWDNLIILDACRYDQFKECNYFSENIELKISRGSDTVEFFKGNFYNKNLTDTVYVTANPKFYVNKKNLKIRFYNVINVWKNEGWDNVYKTVLPETTTEYALKANKKYPNKRLIIHYIQPHYPFIDPPEGFVEHSRLKNPNEDASEGLWYQIMTNKLEVDTKLLWKAYQKNLEIVLPYVRKLIDKVKGKSVITSDHGNMLGEKSYPIPLREWGHPRGIYTDELVKIPWLEINNKEKKIKSEQPLETSENIKDEKVKKRLSHLGYRK